MTSPTAWHDELWFDCHACDWGDCTGRRGCKGNELTARIAELERRLEFFAPTIAQTTDLRARIVTLTALLREARGLLGEEHTTRCRHGYADPPGCEIDDLAHKIDAALAEPSGE